MTWAQDFVCAFGSQELCFRSSLSVSDWAVWVQAFGSVAAILTAWWLSNRQFARELRLEAARRKEDIEQRRLLTLAAVRQLGVAAANALEYMHDSVPPNVPKNYFDDARAALASVAIIDIHDDELASQVLHLRDVARLARAEMEVRDAEARKHLGYLQARCNRLAGDGPETYAARRIE